MSSTALWVFERPHGGGRPQRPHGSPQRRPPARRSRSTPVRTETAAEYFYDYAGQDPINNYDLAGTNTTWPVHPVLGFGLIAIAAWGSTCITNPTCNSGSSIVIKRIWDAVSHSEQLPPSKPGEAGGERGGGRFTPSDRNSILNDNGGKCVYCGDDATQADHVVPRSRGGSGTIGNGQPTCEWCNKSKGARYGPRRRPFADVLWPFVLAGFRLRRRSRRKRDRR